MTPPESGDRRDRLDDDRWSGLLATRATDPAAVAAAHARRVRRPLLTDGRLLLVAADHPARGMLGAGRDPMAMVDRRTLLDRLLLALDHPGVDGVLAATDVLDELALLSALDHRVAIASMNRGGLQGSAWELDDPLTGHTAATIASAGLDGGKVLLRLDHGDPRTLATLVACAGAVGDLAARDLMALVEPLPSHRTDDGRVVHLDDPQALTTAVCVASALGTSSAHTWLKVPAAAAESLAASTLPALVLGGDPGPDPDAEFATWSAAMEAPTVRGLVVGRALLYPRDGDVSGAVDRAARIVRPEGSAL